MFIHYTLRTVEPVIISHSTATTQHQTLDHIPGSALLGAMAAKHYTEFSDEQAFTLFHSGVCRFSPAYPVIASPSDPQKGEIGLPTPASWHLPKGGERTLTNHAAHQFVREELTQYQQLRNGFISSTLHSAAVRTGLAARTALDSQTGRAKEGQLYQYAFIEPGQTFAGWIYCPEPALYKCLLNLLQGELIIGRARSSEFGRVFLHQYRPSENMPTANVKGKELVVWCLSDMACLNTQGQSTLTPDAGDLHPEWKGTLDPSRTFIRTRRVRRFNRARGGLNSEQLLIAAGSVLTYHLDSPPSSASLQDITLQGCGISREQGLGWVAVNPAWADMPEPNNTQLFQPISVTLADVTSSQPSEAEQNSPLLNWIKSHEHIRKQEQHRKSKCQNMHRLVADAYKTLRQYHRLPASYQCGPGNSQWRRLAELVRNPNNSDWKQQAFCGDSAICKASNDKLGWGMEWQEFGKVVNLATKLNQWINELNMDIDDMRLFLEALCRYDISTDKGLSDYREHCVLAYQENK